MLAATALIGAAALSPAAGKAFTAEAAPTEAVVVAPDAETKAADERASPMARRLAMIAAGLGALGFLVRIFGPKKVLRAVEKTAEASVKASVGAAKSVARAARSPLRYLVWIAALILFVMTGVGLYDIEWIGGMMAGAASLATLVFGWGRIGKALQPARARASLSPRRANMNKDC